MSQLTRAQRIVVKIGSALVSEDGRARTTWLSKLAADMVTLNAQGKQLILVSSGAIALGRQYLGDKKPRKLEEKQAAAALGQPPLMAALSQAFAPHNLPVAQALLTLEDTENRRRWLNARATLDTLLNAGALPVINENDTVATDEIRYGDNDRLAARVAQMVGADLLVLLSDIDGLYTANPRFDANAKHISEVSEITAEIEAMAGDANTEAAVGSGGMVTKLAAARIAYAAGCSTVITLGDRERPLVALQDGARATWITPPYNPETARETWLRSHLNPEGEITVDAGAERALKAGSSLLPVGITGVSQGFARGAAVAIKNLSGVTIGKGITAYSATDIDRIKGLKTDAVEAVLGFRGRPAVIHRDDLILG
ncbi:glutamate 5-kinase [Hyphomonas sp. FCG-A18]|uniref:glutamate 5-kinase n=1 Tax=Hyphomonas sp. FCG-A18 TaxID=3080019 RepID=UPI002B2C1827|nr:glutamate 5-kinase [Hyphomonas sp. FCG-A18]